MTTAHGGHRLRPSAVRVRPVPRRLRVRHGHRRLRLWHRRLVLGALLGGAMAGSLPAVAYALLVLEQRQPLEVLQSYGLGAAGGAAAGLLLGLVLSVGLGLLRRFVLPHRVLARSVWVRYRS